MDVGWNCAAAAFGAFDAKKAKIYIHDVYKRGEVEPGVHVQAVKARGEWMHGVMDPAARGRSQADGKKHLDIYRGLGLGRPCRRRPLPRRGVPSCALP